MKFVNGLGITIRDAIDHNDDYYYYCYYYSFYYDISRLLYNTCVHCSVVETFNIRNRKMEEANKSLYLFDLHVGTTYIILNYRVVSTRKKIIIIIIIKRTKYNSIKTHVQSLSSTTSAIDEAFIRCRYFMCVFVFVLLCNFYHYRTDYITDICII